MKVKVIMKVTMKVIMRVIMRVKKTSIDKTKSLEDQIELSKERREFLSEHWPVKYYHDNKKLNYKIFKAKAAYVLNDIPDNSFEKIFD